VIYGDLGPDFAEKAASSNSTDLEETNKCSANPSKSPNGMSPLYSEAMLRDDTVGVGSRRAEEAVVGSQPAQHTHVERACCSHCS